MTSGGPVLQSKWKLPHDPLSGFKRVHPDKAWGLSLGHF